MVRDCKQETRFARFAIAALLAGLGLGLTSCGRTSVDTDKSQVVATVNDHEVTVPQLNEALSLTGQSDPSNVSADLKRRTLDRLVDEELLVQKAVGSQMDRDPAVVRAIDVARRRILAQAFAERNIFPKEQITSAERHEFYEANPLMYEQRKIYQFVTFNVGESQGIAALKAELDAAHSPDQVRDVLNRHQIKYSSEQVVRTSEDLPEDQRAQFAKLATGDVVLASAPGRSTLLISVSNITNTPVDFEQASPRIDQFLIVARNRKAMEDRLKEYRAGSTIAYSEDAASAATDYKDHGAIVGKAFSTQH